jgi:hypothetical protein
VNITLNFPPGVGQVQFSNMQAGAGSGTMTLSANPLNQATVDPTQVDIKPLLSQGFTIACSTGSTASRPTVGTYPGMLYLDTTLAAAGEPIWRNATNTGWVNSSGTAV